VTIMVDADHAIVMLPDGMWLGFCIRQLDSSLVVLKMQKTVETSIFMDLNWLLNGLIRILRCNSGIFYGYFTDDGYCFGVRVC
jgi:hypothetical protein